MAKIYYLRHQAHGVVTEFPFAEPPSEKQTEAVRKFCFQHHGFGHAKTPKDPYWLKVVEAELLGADQVPEVPDRELSAVSSQKRGAAFASESEYGVRGVGHVEVLSKDDVGEMPPPVLTKK